MDKVAADLTRILGPDRLLWEREHLATYGFDGTAALYAEAGYVALPKTTEEVTQVVRYAAQNKIPVVTRGSGTGLSGGSVPVQGCIVLCLVQMDHVLELDQKNFPIHVESGVLTKKVAELADAAGLLYPPDPGSMKISTIGGNVAENSGGLRGLKYGVTRNYVMGLEVVLANGEVAFFGNKCVKDVAGYSMKDLFIGSEGTLGIITKVLLRLVPKPRARRTLVATFSQMDAAAETVSAIIAAKIIPCTLEFLDRITIKCVEEYAHTWVCPWMSKPYFSWRRTGIPLWSKPRRNRWPKLHAATGPKPCNWRRALKRPSSSPPPAGWPFRLWHACRQLPSWKTPRCHAANWPK